MNEVSASSALRNDEGDAVMAKLRQETKEVRSELWKWQADQQEKIDKVTAEVSRRGIQQLDIHSTAVRGG